VALHWACCCSGAPSGVTGHGALGAEVEQLHVEQAAERLVPLQSEEKNRYSSAMSAPDPGRFLEAIVHQNPWLETGDQGLPRVLAPQSERSLVAALARTIQGEKATPFPLLLGPRQVGKSSVMYQVITRLLKSGVSPRRICWMRLDHPLLMGRDLGELVKGSGFLRKATKEEPHFFFLDEVTWAGDWDQWLKTFSSEEWPVRILASSSSTAIHKHRPVESGTGHWSEVDVPPWLFSEYLRHEQVGDDIQPAPTLGETLEQEIAELHPILGLDNYLRRFLLMGAFPETATRPSSGELLSDLLRSQEILRSQTIERSLYRDVPHAFGVQEPAQLERLLHLLASQPSGVLSPTRLAAELGLTQPTIDKYLAYLQRAFLVFTLSNYSMFEDSTVAASQAGSIQRRGRKLYFIDGALRNATTQRGVGLLRDDRELRKLMENAVASHLLALARQEGGRLFHWRKGKVEVGLVYDHPKSPLAFEIGESSMHDTAGLRAFQKRFTRFAERCYIVSPAAVAAGASDSPDGIGRIGIAPLLQIIGAQVEQALGNRFSSEEP